ncbi:MAG TPA: SRPBCC family protein [Chloroflexia bacterium]|jgi:carbon monoxide dehydrogenase subunit G
MQKYSASAVIHQPPEVVFAFLSDMTNNPKWEPGILEMHKVSPGPISVGTQFSEVRKFMGRRMKTLYEVTAYDPPHQFAVRSAAGPMQLEASYTCATAPEGTKVTDSVAFELRGIMSVLRPLFGKMVQSQMQSTLSRLRQVLDQPAD